jgi:hypothetical protein
MDSTLHIYSSATRRNDNKYCVSVYRKSDSYVILGVTVKSRPTNQAVMTEVFLVSFFFHSIQGNEWIVSKIRPPFRRCVHRRPCLTSDF